MVVKVDASGRILLPAEMRRKLGLETGAEVVVHVENQSIRLKARAHTIREAQQYFARFRSDGELWSNELIRERRREARRE